VTARNLESNLLNRKRIKIGFFGTRGLPAKYGGFETIADMLSKKLDKRYFEFYVSKENESRRIYVEKCGDENTFLINFPKSRLYKVNRYLGNIATETKILNDLKNNKFDLDVVFQCGSTPGIFMKKPNSDNSPLLLWNPDGIEWKRKKFPIYGRIALYYGTRRGILLSDAVTIDSLAVANYIKPWIRKNQPIYYLPGGAKIISETDVDETILKDFQVEKYNYYIVVARLAPENHINEIIEWFLESKSKKQLLIISNPGNDKYSKIFLDMVRNFRKRIIFKGPIYDRKTVDTLRFFAYGYFHGHSVGGTNPSLLESLGAGCPPICFDVPFNREVSRNAGLYFNDKSSFIKCLEKLDSHLELRVEHSKLSQKIVEDYYTWDFIVALHEAVAMHSLAYFGKIDKKMYFEWLEQNRFRDKLIERNYDNFVRGVIG